MCYYYMLELRNTRLKKISDGIETDIYLFFPDPPCSPFSCTVFIALPFIFSNPVNNLR
ncbi:hypothetical protein TcasGA2_TC031129 [Tribolium castaneum]|uniref:Uncharacterized protein n=1 Tax=Tribolium castaneum TaxID=7070 RepID=A0A139WIF3_TRICA|nr:hypothetical protein TcasGA2_TC031129 [Tribolium castaneum]